jgi:hypothetical protein
MYVTVLYTNTRFQSDSMILKPGEDVLLEAMIYAFMQNDSVDCSVTYLEGERNFRAQEFMSKSSTAFETVDPQNPSSRYERIKI